MPRPNARAREFRVLPTSLLIGAALAALLAAACASTGASAGQATPEAVPPAEHRAITTEALEPYECGSITRLHTYGGVFLASQPSAADFEQAKKGGVKTVIDLRHASEHAELDEAAVVGSLGLRYVPLPWNGADELTDEVFDCSRALLNEAERPILMHCSSANRVGALWLPWRALDGGIGFDAALAEAKVVGLKSPEFEAKARDYVERHRK